VPIVVLGPGAVAVKGGLSGLLSRCSISQSGLPLNPTHLRLETSHEGKDPRGGSAKRHRLAGCELDVEAYAFLLFPHNV